MFSNLKKTLAVTALVGMSAFPMLSEAAVINTLLPGGQNTIEDSDVELVNDANGNLKTTGTFAIGDVIQSVLQFTTVNTDAISNTIGTPYQLLAYSELKVVGIQDLVDITPGQDLIRLVFGATGNLGTNVLANIYERTLSTEQGYNAKTLTPAQLVSGVTSLPLAAAFGLDYANGDFWFSDAINDINAIAYSQQGTPQSPNGALALSVLNNPGNIDIRENGVISPIDGLFHDVIGGSSIYAKGTKVNAGWLVESNTYVTFASVPEPASLALLGLGLLGMGALRRRKS